MIIECLISFKFALTSASRNCASMRSDPGSTWCMAWCLNALGKLKSFVGRLMWPWLSGNRYAEWMWLGHGRRYRSFNLQFGISWQVVVPGTYQDRINSQPKEVRGHPKSRSVEFIIHVIIYYFSSSPMVSQYPCNLRPDWTMISGSLPLNLCHDRSVKVS